MQRIFGGVGQRGSLGWETFTNCYLGYFLFSISFFSSAVLADFSKLCPPTQELVFVRHGKAILPRISHSGVPPALHTQLPKPAITDRMEDFFIKGLFCCAT